MSITTKPKRTRRSAADRRAQIILAAKSRFAVAGFEGTTTRQIADDMGVAQSLLLYHFENKDDLWKAVMTQIFEHASLVVREEFEAAEGPDPKSQLMAAIRAFIRMCMEEPDLHRLMTMEGRAHSDRLDWLAETYLKPLHDTSVALIAECQERGQVDPGDPTLLYYTILGIAGTLFSFTPEIGLLSPSSVPPDPNAVQERVCAAIFSQNGPNRDE
ncbi:MAG: TetR family transcriptional regulator [Pseudomonadota bacterium]